MGFLEVLTLIFIYLKVTGQIVWSWSLVLAPLLGSLIIYGLFLIFFMYKWNSFGK